jgi:hypothetical protein
MSNAKAQMPNQIQSANDTPRTTLPSRGEGCGGGDVILFNAFGLISRVLNFDMHLTFACLPVGREFEIWTLRIQISLFLFS